MHLPFKPVTVTPLGGLGEIGLNCMLFSTPDSMVMVDCGLMFPEDYHLGIDVVIPRFEYVLENRNKLRAIVLTHGHEDHIGALPWLVPFVDVPIYGSKFTLGLVEHKLQERDLMHRANLQAVKANQRIKLGDFYFNFFRVCHSIIDSFGLGIESPAGRIVHTGDFKIDPNPMNNQFTDLPAFKDFSSQPGGVRLMLSDSTNVERDGTSLNESEILDSLTDIFDSAEGRIIVTLFSSHIQRIGEIIELATTFGRKVAISGRSLSNNIEIAKRLGFLKIPEGLIVEPEELERIDDRECVLIVTGSQGEPLSALARIASGEHRQITIHPGDLVLMSSRFIPVNMRAITKVINNLYRRGAEVLYERVAGIHASGHAHREELITMLQTVRPKYFVPVHGEYRHLVKHTRLAQEHGVAPERTLILENGDPVTLLEEREGIRLEERIPADTILVDGKGVGDVGTTILKERHLLGGEGLVIVVIVQDAETGEITFGPDILSKGFVFEQTYSHVLEDAKCIIMDIYENIPPGETEKLKDRIRSSLRRFFRKVLDRDPVVVPLVMPL